MRKTFMVLVALVMALTMVVGSVTTASAARAGTPVTGVSLDRTAYALNPGVQFTLSATIAPGDATNQRISWSTSNRKVATVAKAKSGANTAIVTAKSGGLAVITVKTADGGYTATCIVGVAPLFEENFDSVTDRSMPTNWTRSSNVTFGEDSVSVYESELEFYCWNDMYESISYRAISPEIDASSVTGGLTLVFDSELWHHDNDYQYWISAEVSTYNGTDWSAWSPTSFVYSPTGVLEAEAELRETVIVDLSSYVGQTFKVCWHMYGYTWWSDNWYVDNVFVTWE